MNCVPHVFFAKLPWSMSQEPCAEPQDHADQLRTIRSRIPSQSTRVPQAEFGIVGEIEMMRLD